MMTHPSLSSLLLTAVLALSACGPGEDATPGVSDTTPLDQSTGVPINVGLTATFNEAMDRETVNTSTFIVTSDHDAARIPGTVVYASGKASFWPSAHLAKNTAFTAKVTTDMRSTTGTPLAAERLWRFTTGETLETGHPVELGAAGNFALLSKSGISTVPTSAITGDVGVSPAAASYLTGFSLTADATNVFSTSPQVTGKVYAADYASPSPSTLTTSISDMQTAFTDSAGRAPGVTELGAGNIGAMTLTAGVYKWGTGLLVPTDVTLTGDANAVFIFQIAQDLTVASAAKVVLSGGVLAKNVFWQVSGAVDLGTTSHFEGVILCQTAVTMRTGASLNGRVLAQTAIDIDQGTVVAPQ